MQDGINVQDGKSFKKNNRAGWNKDVQDGLFPKKNKVSCTIIKDTRVPAALVHSRFGSENHQGTQFFVVSAAVFQLELNNLQ